MNRDRKLFEECIYRFDGRYSVMEEKDIGITADIASVLTPEASVAAMDCLQGCPYTNTAFRFDVITDGERLRAKEWIWLPNAILRTGECDWFCLETLTAVVPQSRTVVQKLTYTGKTGREQSVPIQIAYRGCARYEESWKFPAPKPQVGALEGYSARDRVLWHQNGDCAWSLTSSLENLRAFLPAYLWEGEITIPAEGSLTIYFSAHIGPTAQVERESAAALDRWEELISSSFDYLERETERIRQRLPRLTSDNPRLDQLYYRSLVTYILCRWDNPDLCSRPYYSTGSVNGGCMVSYLWDYCGGLMLHPLYDPEGNKTEIRALLGNDLTSSYALNPVTGGPVGPWYQVNHEKIILMVYYHVLFTGEKSFLFETVGDKTILEWMRFHACVCDDVSRPVALYDYGEKGNDHLELRRGIPYNGVMPDLNARRYLNYLRVYELTVIAGQPDEVLPRRAAALKEELKALWNEEAQWYDFIGADGKRDIRYTVQMFKFLNSPVIGKKEREGLISHLNEREFLSKFGLHSMSKLDPAYDQDDIDNGGGGICTHFTMQICAQLYEMGYETLATDILSRVYWWGERLVYMGDSCAANRIANREDTPLQGDISSVACAQMIFYSIFGIRAEFDGRIRISPVAVRPAENMRVENARLCGKEFAVEIRGDRFSVTVGDRVLTASVGEEIWI